MKKKYNILIIPICLLLVLFLSGCGSISSEKELIDYANNNFGKAKFINFQKEKDKSTATFQDEEYGFTYTVTSYIDSYQIDGSSFGEFETKSDTYTKSFISYLKDITQNQFSDIQNKYNCTLEWNDYYSPVASENIIISVYLKDKNVTENVTTALGQIIKEIDNRNHLNNAIIYGEYNDEFVGKYSLANQSYINSNDSNINWAMENAYQIMKTYKGISINNVEELTYINSEEMDVNNIPGISNETLSYRIDDTEDSLKHTMVYYYKFNNEMWLVADCMVAPYNHLYVHKLD